MFTIERRVWPLTARFLGVAATVLALVGALVRAREELALPLVELAFRVLVGVDFERKVFLGVLVALGVITPL